MGAMGPHRAGEGTVVRDRSRAQRIVRGVALAVLMALVVTGCQRRVLWMPGPDSTYGNAYVTRDGDDTYDISATNDGVNAVALPDNQDSNTRVMLWPKGVARATDSESCATWTRTEGSAVQQGAAFRVTRVDTRVRAVTITQNIAFGAYWTFNVHTWDTARTGPAFVGEGQIVLRQWAEGRPLPWRVCGRVIGNRVQLRVWSPGEPEAAWDTPGQSGSVTLPAGWQQEGQTGWYVGHLRADEQATYSGLGTWTYDPEQSGRTATVDRAQVAA